MQPKLADYKQNISSFTKREQEGNGVFLWTVWRVVVDRDLQGSEHYYIVYRDGFYD